MDNQPTYIVIRNYLHEELLNATDIESPTTPCLMMYGANRMYGLAFLEKIFIQERVQDRYDYIVFVDEDCYVHNADTTIPALIKRMEEDGADMLGVPDGGVINHRNHRDDVPNLFFTIFKSEKIRKSIFAREYYDYVIPTDGPETPTIKYDTFEPYYKMLCFLRYKLGMVFLPLTDVINCKDETTIVRNNNERACTHAWLSRQYSTHPEQKARIDKVLADAKEYDNNNVTFVIPNRGGTELERVIENFKFTFNPKVCGVNWDVRFLVVEQADDMPFMRGQLYNIALDHVNTKWIGLIDNDIFNLNSFNPVEEYQRLGGPYVAFDRIAQLQFFENGEYTILSEEKRAGGFGAFNFMQTDDLKKCGGFSNLCMAWGAEDNILNEKIHFARKKWWTLGHIAHPKRTKDNLALSDRNKRVYGRYRNGRINPQQDGWRQTTYTLASDDHGDVVRTIKVKEIGVTDGYMYMDVLRRQQESIQPQRVADEENR